MIVSISQSPTRSFVVNNSRSFIYADSVRYLAVSIIGFNTLATFFIDQAKVWVKIIAAFLVIKDKLIDGLMTNCRFVFNFESAADLFRAPFIF